MLNNIEVLTHSSIRIKDGDRTIYVDPFQIEGTPKDGDFILVTHEHYDHFSPEDIEKVIKEDSVLVVPTAMKDMATAAGINIISISTNY